VIETLNAAAVRARTAPEAVLDDHPWLGAAIDEDAAAGRFDAWGSSTVIDEYTQTAIIAPPLFEALHARADVPAQWPVGNAGLLHVYGYLLSTEPTPYGLKRTRWLDGALAEAYGRVADAFVPWAHPRTLLDRVSEAATGLLERDVARTSSTSGTETTLALGRARTEGSWALAYAVNGLLVTTFVVHSAEEILVAWDADPERLRWNAVVLAR
jgi:hypothetical protein